MPSPSESAIREALGRVIDPELRRSLTELEMVREIAIEPDGAVTVGVALEAAGEAHLHVVNCSARAHAPAPPRTPCALAT